jgi:hypothetical protein
VAIYETTSVGIHEQQSPTIARLGELRIWPNVTGGKVCFAVDGVARSFDITVYDVSGKRLGKCLRASEKGGETQGVIDLTGHAAGVYIVRVKSEGKNLTAKVVKANRR